MPEPQSSANPKYRRIYEELAEAIRREEYAPGARLPPERELAQRFGVHRMTVRQATAALVRAGLVVRRRPAGVFVRQDWQHAGGSRGLNLICPAADSMLVRVFIEYAMRASRRHDYRPRLLRVFPGDEQLAAEAVLDAEPSLVLGLRADPYDELGQAIRKAADRVVLLGGRLDHLGVHSIMGDDEMGLRLAVEHLKNAGHRRIALVCSAPGSGHPLLEMQIQHWRAAMMGGGTELAELDQHIIRLDEASMGGTTLAACEAVKRYLHERRGRATALITLNEEAADGAAAACWQLDLRIPQDVSLVAYAGTYYAALATPPRTVIDVELERHVDLGLEILVGRGTDAAASAERLHLVRPKLIERGTVAGMGALGFEPRTKGL